MAFLAKRVHFGIPSRMNFDGSFSGIYISIDELATKRTKTHFVSKEYAHCTFISYEFWLFLTKTSCQKYDNKKKTCFMKDFLNRYWSYKHRIKQKKKNQNSIERRTSIEKYKIAKQRSEAQFCLIQAMHISIKFNQRNVCNKKILFQKRKIHMKKIWQKKIVSISSCTFLCWNKYFKNKNSFNLCALYFICI